MAKKKNLNVSIAIITGDQIRSTLRLLSNQGKASVVFVILSNLHKDTTCLRVWYRAQFQSPGGGTSVPDALVNLAGEHH